MKPKALKVVVAATAFALAFCLTACASGGQTKDGKRTTPEYNNANPPILHLADDQTIEVGGADLALVVTGYEDASVGVSLHFFDCLWDNPVEEGDTFDVRIKGPGVFLGLPKDAYCESALALNDVYLCSSFEQTITKTPFKFRVTVVGSDNQVVRGLFLSDLSENEDINYTNSSVINSLEQATFTVAQKNASGEVVKEMSYHFQGK